MSDQSPSIRAADADRERVIEQLRAHAAAGRLDTDELELRVHSALEARTLGELEPLLRDLPGRAAPARRRRPRERRQQELRSFLALAALLIGIWALSGMGYFWPAWPLLGVSFMCFGVCGGHRGHGKRRRSARSARGYV